MNYSDFCEKKYCNYTAKQLAIEYNRMQLLKGENSGSYMMANSAQGSILAIIALKDKKFKMEFRKYLGGTYE